MEIKKSSKASLENGKSIALLMGFVVGLSVLFVSFEWGTKELNISAIKRVIDTGPTLPPVLPPDVPVAPPPPPAPKVKEVIAEVLAIVENNVPTENYTIISVEDTKGLGVQPVSYAAPAVTIKEEEPAPPIHEFVEIMPSFPGGNAELMAFLSQNVKYPVVPLENGIQGRVVCRFVVNTDGSIVDVEVVRGVDPYLDKEAARVIASMPNWEPGRQQNKPVRVRFTVPVVFKIKN